MAYLLGAPVRTGKTTRAVREADALLRRNPQAKVVFIGPSWGEFGTPDSGVGETIVRYFRDVGRDCSIAGGKWRTCTDWREACGTRTPTPREHHALTVKLCRPCNRETRRDVVAGVIALSEAPPSAPEFPQHKVCAAGLRPAVRGLVGLYHSLPGSVWITTPTTPAAGGESRLDSLIDVEGSP